MWFTALVDVFVTHWYPTAFTTYGTSTDLTSPAWWGNKKSVYWSCPHWYKHPESWQVVWHQARNSTRHLGQIPQKEIYGKPSLVRVSKEDNRPWGPSHCERGPQVVFTGPVHWTGKKTEIELNPTAKDRTTSCSCTNSENFLLPAARFVEKLKNQKKTSLDWLQPVFHPVMCWILLTHIFL